MTSPHFVILNSATTNIAKNVIDFLLAVKRSLVDENLLVGPFETPNSKLESVDVSDSGCGY